MNIIEYIKTDLENSGIKEFSFDNKHVDSSFISNKIINATNSIIYFYYLKSNDNESGTLTSFDFDVKIAARGINESIFKFLNDVEITNFDEYKYIKVNYVK